MTGFNRRSELGSSEGAGSGLGPRPACPTSLKPWAGCWYRNIAEFLFHDVG
jgi:hypothetical protein